MSLRLCTALTHGHMTRQALAFRAEAIRDIHCMANKILQIGENYYTQYPPEFRIQTIHYWPWLVVAAGGLTISYQPRLWLAKVPSYWRQWKIRTPLKTWYSLDLPEVMLPKLEKAFDSMI